MYGRCRRFFKSFRVGRRSMWRLSNIFQDIRKFPNRLEAFQRSPEYSKFGRCFWCCSNIYILRCSVYNVWTDPVDALKASKYSALQFKKMSVVSKKNAYSWILQIKKHLARHQEHNCKDATALLITSNRSARRWSILSSYHLFLFIIVIWCLVLILPSDFWDFPWKCKRNQSIYVI